MIDKMQDKKYIVDLHSHSTCSDGTCTPTRLVEMAREVGIDILALTDHDTVAGIEEAKFVGDKVGVRIINGVEISCNHTIQGGYGKQQQANRIIHVVALNFTDIHTLQANLKHVQDSRANRGLSIVKKLGIILAKQGIGNASSDDIEVQIWEKVLRKTNQNPNIVGRAHIAQVMQEMGVVNSVQAAFDKYLADKKSAYVPIETLSLNDTIALIHKCGGIAVLAHPTRYGLSATRIRRLIADFAKLGGDGCELPAPSEPISTRKMIDRLVAENNLMVSVGSDFHGDIMPWRRLGRVAIPTKEQTTVWQAW